MKFREYISLCEFNHILCDCVEKQRLDFFQPSENTDLRYV